MERIEAMLKSRFRARLVAAALSLNIGIGFVTAQTVSTADIVVADVNDCFIRGGVQNPHNSDTAGGIVSTAFWDCNLVPSVINLSSIDTGYFLYLCPTQPFPDVDGIQWACTFMGSNRNDISFTAAGEEIVHAPPGPGAHGSGWWIAWATWFSTGPNGVGATVTEFSNAVPLSG